MRCLVTRAVGARAGFIRRAAARHTHSIPRPMMSQPLFLRHRRTVSHALGLPGARACTAHDQAWSRVLSGGDFEIQSS